MSVIRTEFPGAQYADSLPSGEYALLYDRSHIQTHDRRIELPAPGDQPLYHRITNIGGFQIAGQGITPTTWWWSEPHGWMHQPEAIGDSPVIFDNLGHLHIATKAIEAQIGSQGWRYVAPDGTLVTGDDTYTPSTELAHTLGVQGLAEWTAITADLFIGQSATDNQDNAWVWDGTHHRLLEPGPCRFIRATRSGDQVAIAIWKPQFGAVLYWLTVADLRALPIVTQAQPAPAPAPKPAPTPEPKPVSTPNRLDIVRTIAARYPALVKLNTKDACGILTEYIALELHAADPGWGLLSKSAGENNYRGHAVDAVIYQPTQQVIDLMSGAGDRDLLASATTVEQIKAFDHDIRVKWDEVGKRPDNNWMAPIQPIQVVGPALPPAPAPPPSQPPAPSVDLTPLRNELAALAARLDIVFVKLDALHQRVSALETKPAPTYKATGSTSRDFAHSHRINVTLEPL